MYQPCEAFGHRSRPRRGAMATELIVAATLLVSVIGTAVPLAIGARRIQRDARHYQLAIEELSNQLDRLSSLDSATRDAALTALAPSEEISQVLGDATLAGQVVRDADGTRLVVTLDWQRPAGAVRLRLADWLDTMPEETAEKPSKQAEEVESL